MSFRDKSNLLWIFWELPDTTWLGLPGRTAEKRPGVVSGVIVGIYIYTWSVWEMLDDLTDRTTMNLT